MLRLLPHTETFPVLCTDASIMRLIERVCSWKPDDRQLYIHAHHEKCTKNILFGWNSDVYAVVNYIQSPNMSKAWNKDDFSQLRTENARKKIKVQKLMLMELKGSVNSFRGHYQSPLQ